MQIPLRTSVCLILVILSGLSAPVPASVDRPNIVLLLADDLGWGDVGYHGGAIRTPNLDRLATEGIRLENFHVCPLCSPTRAGLMTGRWPIRYGMMKSVITPLRQYGLPTSEQTLAELLARAGYRRRGVFGKWHLGHYRKELLPLARGFTHFVGCYNGAFDYFSHKREGQLDWHRDYEPCRDQGYVTDLIGREAARFIEGSPAESPFFLYVPFTAPHVPLQAKETDIAKYGHIADEKKKTYAAMVDSLDQAIGRILAALAAKGVTDNTCVFFLSDNGAASTGDNGDWRGAKGSVYEGGIRVPALMRWPAGRLVGGRVIDTLMGYIDVYPTIKRLAGLTETDPHPLDGLDILNMIDAYPQSPQRHWYSYIAQGPEKSAISDGTWKLVVTRGSVLEVADAATQVAPRLELFNLTQDPQEQTNLIEQEPNRLQRLLSRLQAFRRLKIEGLPDWTDGREGFQAPADWVISD